MRRARWQVVLALAIASGAGAERIRSFDATITVEREDAFVVEETIAYDFGGEQRHGIFRRIPVRYGRGYAADYRIGLEVEGVDDGAGRAQPYRVSREGADAVVRIGDPDRTVSGEHTYRIRYRVTRGVLYFDGHDEIYWNVTGTEWPVAIDRAAVRLVLPERIETGSLRTACFTGPQGATYHGCTIAPAGGTTVTASATAPLPAGHGLTVTIGLPKGVLIEPSALARWWSRVRDWLSPLYALPLGVLALMTFLWRRFGRDPTGGAAIPVRYEPPEDATAAEVGTLVDETVHLADITATIIDLAVRGFLRIEEWESTTFLFLNHRDYELIRLKPATGLTDFEATLFAALFAGGERVAVSSLKDKFYTHVPNLKRALYAAAVDKGWFRSSPEQTRIGWRVAGGAVLFGALPIAAANEGLAPAIPIVITGAIVIAFAGFMPRRTRAGRKAYEEILGFKEFLARVDADRLERTGGRTAGRFERVLPYAVVLGVADQWATAFADVYTEPPTWYVSSRPGFHSRTFVSDVGSSMQTIGTTMTSRPSGSGSSGFSSGGGFSGGGFGGGGGGSW